MYSVLGEMYFCALVIVLFNTVSILSEQGKWKDEEPFLLVLERNSVLKIDFHNSSNFEEYTDDDYSRSMVALDYDYEKEFIFYSDVHNENIKRSSLKSDKQNYFGNGKIIASVGVHTPNGLCVDWVNERVYWTDAAHNKIEVCKYDGTLRTVLFATGLSNPRAIAVDPSIGWMFWSDTGRDAKIERAGMDGSQRQVIARTGVGWPNGLTLDHDEKRVYWIDAKYDVIESSNYDGTERTHIVFNNALIDHPVSLDIFEDYMYWTDWSPISVNRAYKRTGGNAETFFNSSSQTLYGIRVLYNRKRNTDLKVCYDQCNPCLPSELCLATPKITGDRHVTYKCVKSNSTQSAGDAIAEKDISILVSADGKEIMMVLPNGSDWQATVPGLKALGYLFDAETIFFSNVRRREINSVSLRSDGVIETLVTNVDCNSSEGIAVDWIHGLVYWLDTNINGINVYSANSRTWTTLIKQNLSDLWAIEADPVAGWLFWTSCGPSPKIERSALDGRQRKIIIWQDIVCPNALALDIEESVLYFYDVSKGLIETVDYQGENRRIIVSTGHSISLDVFQEYLYWSDGGTIYQGTKCDGSGLKAIETFVGISITDISVYHKDKQKSGLNVCQNSQCSHLCLPTTNITGERVFTCACPAMMYLNEDDLKLCSYKSIVTSSYAIDNFKLNRELGVLSFLAVLFLQ